MSTEEDSRPLEEKLTFQEREMEHLREQITELWLRLATVEKHLEQVARRLEDSLAKE